MMAMRKTLSRALGFVLLGFGTLALATEGSRPQPPSRSEDRAAEAASPKRISPFVLAARGPQRSARSKVYTNQDLERMFGPPEAGARAAEGSAALAPVVAFVPPHQTDWMAELDRAREELRKAKRQLEALLFERADETFDEGVPYGGASSNR